MLMLTFTSGSEVGLFKQQEVCKVKKRITDSHCASEVRTSTWTCEHSDPDSSTDGIKLLAWLRQFVTYQTVTANVTD